jgi:hypothetical protein
VEVGRFIVIFDRSRITAAIPVVYEVGRLPVN